MAFLNPSCAELEQPFDYVLEMKSHAGETWREKDAYSFGPVLGEMDIYLFNEGTHYEVYKKLGAHMMELGGVAGTHFAVWAPNAQRVSVVGDFNHWDGRVHAMRKMIPSGIWEIFVPHVQEGAHYKIRGSRSAWRYHAQDRPLRLFCAAWNADRLHGLRHRSLRME